MNARFPDWPLILAAAVPVILSLATALAAPRLLAAAGVLDGASDEAAPAEATLTVVADARVEEPVTAIAAEYQRRTGRHVTLRFQPVAKVDTLAKKSPPRGIDILVAMAAKDQTTAVASLDGAGKVAWKHPQGWPVWAAAVSDKPEAAELRHFLGGPTGHRLWSQSKAGFTIVSGENRAEAFEWVVKNRVGHTYRMTAMRMLREVGGIRKGVLIDVGCGSGDLMIELAGRSEFKMTGLDIDPDVGPILEKKVREAGLSDRISFVCGDAQKLPFPDDYADVITSRGTLCFIPDIGQALREADRVLKPTGVAFMGGRYLYTPQEHKITTEKLRRIVASSGVAGAEVVEHRGQWVKIVGPKAPEAAHQFQGGPDMLAGRITVDYAITEGDALLLCGSDGGLEQALQKGFLEMTDLQLTALYPKEEVAEAAKKRIAEAGHADRITCAVGDVHHIPFGDASFDLVAGVGPILLWGDRETGMKEIYRVLRQGGAGLVGGRFLYMPDWRKTPSDVLRKSATATGLPGIRVYDDMGQWIEFRKGIKDRGFAD